MLRAASFLTLRGSLNPILLCLFFIIFIAILLSGCGLQGSANGLRKVNGVVTFDGEPIEDGTIVFSPIDGAGGSHGADIVDGNFTIATTPGTKSVLITSYRILDGVMDVDGFPVTEQFVPNQYNKNTTLTVDVLDQEMDNITFDLTSSK